MLIKYTIVFLFIGTLAIAQSDSLILRTNHLASIGKDEIVKRGYDPLSPARAAFYSAVLPGLGQVYNKSYWKVPIVYAALGTSTYFIIRNNKQYHRYRDAYKRRLEGYTDDDFYGRISDEGLISAQRTYSRNMEIAVLVTVGFYILNIVDANVDAHLNQFNVNNDLSFSPQLDMDFYSGKTIVGLNFKYNF